MVFFGQYLKDYLESARISQTEFSTRLGITQKHMNEILNGKKNITLEMAGNIQRLTGIDSKFIITIENNRKIEENLIEQYETRENLNNYLRGFPINDLKKYKWLVFRDESNVFQKSIDLLDFLKVKDFNVFNELEKKVLFKKSGEDYKKLCLWIARCDELSHEQVVRAYNSRNFDDLIKDLKLEAYNKNFNLKNIQIILNNYGILFIVEKALPGTKVRGVFKVNGNTPAIYITKMYNGKDSFYLELFHELKHCKSDYNEAKNKIIADGDLEKEKAADQFALDTMIDPKLWSIILKDYNEKNILKISEEYKIPPSFIVGRLAYHNFLKYSSQLYNTYKNI